MNARGSNAPTPSPGTFRCLVCKRTVTGTPSGHCPTCGYVPPRRALLAPRAARPLGRAPSLRQLRRLGGRIGVLLLLGVLLRELLGS